MTRTNPDGHTHACMHAHTHAHTPYQNSNSYEQLKGNNIHVYILEQTPKSDYISINSCCWL